MAFGGFVGGYFTRQALQLAADYERAAVSFEIMTKSATKGKALLDDLTKLAMKSPFTTQELTGAAKQVLAFGFDVEEVSPILERLGSISVATGSDLDRLILAFGQVRTTGRLMGQELRQFTNAGVPILEYLAKVLGVSAGQIPNLVRQGKVGFGDVAKAINMMTNEGGLFNGMLDRINEKTVYGRWRNFVETIQLIGRNLGGAAFEAFRVRDVLGELADLISGADWKKATDVFIGLRVALYGLWRGVVNASQAVTEFVRRYKETVAIVLASIVIVHTVTTAWAGLMFVLGILTTPFGLAVTAVSGLLIALNELGAFESMGGRLADGFRDFAGVVGEAWQGVKDAIAGNDIELAWDIVLKTMKIGWQTMLISLEAEFERFLFNFDFNVGKNLKLKWNDIATGARKAIAEAVGDTAEVQRLEAARKRANANVEADYAARMLTAKPAMEAEVARIMDQIPNLASKQELKSLIEDSKMRAIFPKGTTAGNIDAMIKDRTVDEGGGHVIQKNLHDLLPTAPGGVGLSGVLGGAAVAGPYHELYKKAAFDIQDVRTAMLRGLSPEQMKPLVTMAKESTKALDDFSNVLMGVGAAAKLADIGSPFEFKNKEVINFARDLQKEFEAGVGPMGKYARSIELLNEAVRGPLPESFRSPLSGVIGGAGFAGNFGGIVGKDEEAFGRYKFFQELQKSVGTPGSRLPPTMMAGSREAAETINRSNAQALSVQEQVLSTIREGVASQRRVEEYERQVLEVLKNNPGASVQIKPMGFGPNK